MITPEERESIIYEAQERIMLVMPQIIGNLMLNNIMKSKIAKKFFDSHADLKNHQDIVQAIIEDVEGSNTIEDYEKILEKAVPEIRKKIALMNKMNMTPPTRKPDLGAL